MFSKRRLNGIEQLARKDLFAGVIDASELSPVPAGDEQTSLTPMADYSYAGLMETPVAELSGGNGEDGDEQTSTGFTAQVDEVNAAANICPGGREGDDQTSLSPVPYPDGQTLSCAPTAEISPGMGDRDGQTSLMPTPPPVREEGGQAPLLGKD